MSATATIDTPSARLLKFEPRQRLIISAHADCNRGYYVFPRAQSMSLRATPWEARLKPLKSWTELAGYAASMLMGVMLLSTLMGM